MKHHWINCRFRNGHFRNIQKILRVTQWKKMDFVKCVGKHLAVFSEGVLASVVATVLMK